MSEIADRLASEQREISVSEFFTKNRHLLGFDNPGKALLTAIKEAVDNSLDACEEAGVLPEIKIDITEIYSGRFKVCIVDNGPGIVHLHVPKVFGKLLYGSKFHRLKQSRGQQGIGISAAGMYSDLTTGKPVTVISKVQSKPAYFFEIKIDTKTNNPIVLSKKIVEWEVPSGTLVQMELEGSYKSGKRSVDQYIEQTAIANPHSRFIYINPKREQFIYERLVDELPREPTRIKPHPYGTELGIFMNMIRDTHRITISDMLRSDFSRVSDRSAKEMCTLSNVDPSTLPRDLQHEQIELLHRSMSKVKLQNPPNSCVVPIGEELIIKGMTNGIKPDLVCSVTRAPSIYRGYPFIIEAGIAYGGNIDSNDAATLFRFANRVPLQYQQSDCAISKAAIDIDWKMYGLQQSSGSLPVGPLVIMVHMASVWVPFTSESKEAIARYPEILAEIKLALQACGRKLALHLKGKAREAEAGRKRGYIETYIPHISLALKSILGCEVDEMEISDRLVEMLRTGASDETSEKEIDSTEQEEISDQMDNSSSSGSG